MLLRDTQLTNITYWSIISGTISDNSIFRAFYCSSFQVEILGQIVDMDTTSSFFKESHLFIEVLWSFYSPSTLGILHSFHCCKGNSSFISDNKILGVPPNRTDFQGWPKTSDYPRKVFVPLQLRWQLQWLNIITLWYGRLCGKNCIIILIQNSRPPSFS